MTSRNIGFLACLLAAPALLSGCGKEEDSGKGAAAQQVLPGSASDAMLPLDTVRSQPPPAPQATENGRAGESEGPEPSGDEEPGAAADAGEAAAEAAPAPAQPEPAATPAAE